MEESDERGGESPPPFWTSNSPHPSPSSSNLLLNPWLIFIIAPIISLFLLVAIPHLSSFLPRIFSLKHSNNVKKTWDTLNLLLVAFAIICGILCRSSNDGNHNTSSISNAEGGEYKTLKKSESSNGEDRQIPRWLDQYRSDPAPLFNRVEPPPPAAADSDSTRTATFGRLRSSSSYPDLRKQEAWASDDVDASRSRRQSDQGRRRRRSYGEKDLEDSVLKTIPVDTFTLRHPTISTNSPAQRASSSASRSAEKARCEFQTLPQKEEKRRSKAQEIKNRQHAQPPPPPPPPPPPSQRSEQQGSGGKRSSRGAKDIKSALSFLYHQRKKKRQENRKSFDASGIPSSMPASNPIPKSIPPPPAPPPSASVFHHIFPKKSSSSYSKISRIHSIPVPPPPPPPPKKLTTTRRPPMPEKDRDEDLGGESRCPLIPMPPPPPPPPFKMQALRFAVRGEFVRVQSGLSDSSEASDVIEIPSNEANANAISNAAAVFCPSPDVNTKADSFIANFWAGLKLEKMNSLREREKKTAEADSAPADQEQQ